MEIIYNFYKIRSIKKSEVAAVVNNSQNPENCQSFKRKTKVLRTVKLIMRILFGLPQFCLHITHTQVMIKLDIISHQSQQTTMNASKLGTRRRPRVN